MQSPRPLFSMFFESLLEIQVTDPTIHPFKVYSSVVWGILLIFKNCVNLHIT